MADARLDDAAALALHEPDAAASPPVDAQVADSAAASAETPLDIPPVRGPVKRVTQGKTIVLGGVSIRFHAASHKHAMTGHRSRGSWTFSLARRGKTREVTLSSSADRFEAEVVAHGAMFVFRKLGYFEYEIVLAAARAPKPLDEDACEAAIDAAATRAGLPRGTSSSSSEESGVLRHQELGWVGHCGTYTRRVWFMQRDS